MKQIELMYRCQHLRPNWATDIPYEEVKEAVKEDFSFLDQACVREHDVLSFCEKISKNWNVNISYDNIRKVFTFYKPDDTLQGFKLSPELLSQL